MKSNLKSTLQNKISDLCEELGVLPRWPDSDGGIVAPGAEDALGPLLRVGIGDVGDGQVGLGLLCNEI